MADDRRTTSAGAPGGAGGPPPDSIEDQARAAKARAQSRKARRGRPGDGRITAPPAPTAGRSDAEDGAGDGQIRSEARHGSERAKEVARDKAEEVKHMAERKAREAGEGVERRSDEWSSALGRRTGRLAYALRTASDTLRDEGENAMADMADQAADQADRMAGYLQDEDPSGMLDDLQRLGRSNPAAFLGVSFALGLATARFLKASSPDHDTDSPHATPAASRADAQSETRRGGRYARAARPGSRPTAGSRGPANSSDPEADEGAAPPGVASATTRTHEPSGPAETGGGA